MLREHIRMGMGAGGRCWREEKRTIKELADIWKLFLEQTDCSCDNLHALIGQNIKHKHGQVLVARVLEVKQLPQKKSTNRRYKL